MPRGRRKSIAKMRPAKGGFSPLGVAGLTLWLDAKDPNTLYDANVAGSLVADGGTVGRWEDKSGNGRHFTQATGANEPVWTGGRIVFPFNGSSSSVLLTSGLAISNFASTTDNCWIVVARFPGTPTAGTQLIGNPASTGTVDLSVAAGPVMRFIAWNGTSGQSIVASAPFAGDTTYVIIGRRNGATLGISLNGGTEATVTTAGALTQNVGNLGIPFPTAAACSDIWFYEAILFDVDPGLAIRNAAGAALAAKHGAASWTPLAA